MSAKLLFMEERAASLEDRLRSLDREIDAKTVAFQRWREESDKLGRNRGAEQFHQRNATAIREEVREIKARTRALDDQTTQTALLNAEVERGAAAARRALRPAAGAAAGASGGRSGGGIRGVLRGGVGLGPLLAGGALGLPVIGQAVGALAGAAGGGMAGLATGGAAAYGGLLSGYAGGAAVYAGAMPVGQRIQQAMQARQQLAQLRVQRATSNMTGAEFRDQRSRILHGQSDAALEAASSLQQLQRQYARTFASGDRGTRQMDALNKALDFAGRRGIPMVEEAWDAVFPVVNRDLSQLERWLGSAQGGHEWSRFVSTLAPATDTLARMAGQAARFGAGIVEGLAPLTRWGGRRLTDFFGTRADWLQSQRGMQQMSDITRAAQPILAATGDVIGAIATGFRDLLVGNGGRAATYVLEHLAQETIPRFVRFIDRAAEETPRFVDVLSQLADIAGHVFGPNSAFYIGITLLNNLTTAAADAVAALGPLGGVLQAGIGTAGLLAVGRRFPGGGAVLGAGAGATFGGVPGALIGGALGYGASRIGRAGAAATEGAEAARGGGGFLSRFLGRINPFSSAGGEVGMLGRLGRFAGRAFLPLSIGLTAYDALRAAQGGGGTAGGGMPPGPITQAQAGRLIGARSMARTGRAYMHYDAQGFPVGTGPTRDLTQVAGQITPQLRMEQRRIGDESRQRARAVGDLYRSYRRVTDEIRKQRDDEAAVKQLTQQRRDIANQIAETSPTSVRYGRFGQVTGINRPALERQRAGLAGGTVTPQAVAGRYRALTRQRRQSRGAMRDLVNLATQINPVQGAELEHALATGDNAAILTIQRELEQQVPNPAAITSRFQSYQQTTMRTGTFQQVLERLRDLQPVFRRHIGDMKDYRRIIRGISDDAREREGRLNRQQQAMVQGTERGGGARRRLRGAFAQANYYASYDVRRNASQIAADNQRARNPRAAMRDIFEQQAAGIREGRGQARRATQQVKETVVRVLGNPQDARDAHDAGQTLGRRFADGVWERRAIMRRNALVVVRAALKDTWDTQITYDVAHRAGQTMARKFADGVWERRQIMRTNALVVVRAALKDTWDTPVTYGAARGTGRKITEALAAGIRQGIPRVRSAAAAATAAARLGGGGPGPSGTGDPGSWKGGNTLAFTRAVDAKFGLRFSSGWRSPEHNAEVGGVPNSQHTHGTPRNPGATDSVGSPANMYRAAAYARAHGVPNVLVHDAGSGLHLHMGFFDKGGRIPGAHGQTQAIAVGHGREFMVTGHGEALLEQMTGERGVLDRLERMQKPNSMGSRGSFNRGGTITGTPAHTRSGGAGGGNAVVHITMENVHVANDQMYERLVTRLADDLELALRNRRG